MVAALLQSFSLNAMATLWHSPLAALLWQRPAAIIRPQCCRNPVAFTSGHIAMAVSCCNHSASMLQQPCGIHLWLHCYGSALLQSFGLNDAATLWHSPLAALLWQRPAAIIQPQCRGNPVAFTSGRIAMAAPCCNHSALMLQQPCGIYLWPAAALLQSFGLNATETLWHLPLAGSCPAAIIRPQCWLHKALLLQSILI